MRPDEHPPQDAQQALSQELSPQAQTRSQLPRPRRVALARPNRPTRGGHMAHMGGFLFWRHLRAEPNQHILHFRRGRLSLSGAGVAYWFNPLNAAIAMLPVEDCETTFLLKERSRDFQEVSVQCTLTYRIADPEKAARRVNFSIAIANGAWLESPLERLASLWAQRAQPPARDYLRAATVEEAVREGAEPIRRAMHEALAKDVDVAAMGLALVSLQVARVAPSADLEKALQSPTREAIQQRADEAGFARRANAVEKERAIKQNELMTEIDLAERQAELLARQGRNKLQTVQAEAEAERARVEAELGRQELAARAYAEQIEVRARGESSATRLKQAALVEAERERVGVLRETPPGVLLAMAAQELAGKIQTIQHLNLTPDLLRDTFQQFLRDGPGAAPPGKQG
jgi:regulator of protease activity HflC (stomatin/prohibitin superfamily)